MLAPNEALYIGQGGGGGGKHLNICVCLLCECPYNEHTKTGVCVPHVSGICIISTGRDPSERREPPSVKSRRVSPKHTCTGPSKGRYLPDRIEPPSVEVPSQ